jgi:hypothetical protein
LQFLQTFALVATCIHMVLAIGCLATTSFARKPITSDNRSYCQQNVVLCLYRLAKARPKGVF